MMPRDISRAQGQEVLDRLLAIKSEGPSALPQYPTVSHPGIRVIDRSSTLPRSQMLCSAHAEKFPQREARLLGFAWGSPVRRASVRHPPLTTAVTTFHPPISACAPQCAGRPPNSSRRAPARFISDRCSSRSAAAGSRRRRARSDSRPGARGVVGWGVCSLCATAAGLRGRRWALGAVSPASPFDRAAARPRGGAGKSTFIEALGMEWIKLGFKVAVVAVTGPPQYIFAHCEL